MNTFILFVTLCIELVLPLGAFIGKEIKKSYLGTTVYVCLEKEKLP